MGFSSVIWRPGRSSMVIEFHSRSRLPPVASLYDTTRHTVSNAIHYQDYSFYR